MCTAKHNEPIVADRAEASARAGRRLDCVRMRPRLKVWIETDNGHVALSEWRVMLLESVAERGSLVAAAKALGVPHRTAWQRIQEMEACLGVQLLDTISGGVGGGRSHLTPAAADLVDRYRSLRSGLDDLVLERFAALFGTTPARLTGG